MRPTGPGNRPTYLKGAETVTKNSGRVHEQVAMQLLARGINPKGLEIATLGRGPDHLVLLNGEPIGGYNHVSKKVFLYIDMQNASE